MCLCVCVCPRVCLCFPESCLALTSSHMVEIKNNLAPREQFLPLWLAWTNSRNSYCTTPGVGVGVGVGGGVGVSKKFEVKFFYVMGNALSGELSCPCDRSCFTIFSTYISN